MTLPALSKVSVYINWKINQDYIAAYLCENKSKPDMKCNGKCILMKSLKCTQTNTDYPTPIDNKDFNWSPFVLDAAQRLVHNIDAKSLQQNDFNYQSECIKYLSDDRNYPPPNPFG